ERLTWRFLKDNTARYAALASGKVHAIFNLPPESVPTAQADERIETQDFVHSCVPFALDLNTTHPALADLRVRRALAHAPAAPCRPPLAGPDSSPPPTPGCSPTRATRSRPAPRSTTRPTISRTPTTSSARTPCSTRRDGPSGTRTDSAPATASGSPCACPTP